MLKTLQYRGCPVRELRGRSCAGAGCCRVGVIQPLTGGAAFVDRALSKEQLAAKQVNEAEASGQKVTRLPLGASRPIGDAAEKLITSDKVGLIGSAAVRRKPSCRSPSAQIPLVTAHLPCRS